VKQPDLNDLDVPEWAELTLALNKIEWRKPLQRIALWNGGWRKLLQRIAYIRHESGV
jgi:hypothetical protein